MDTKLKPSERYTPLLELCNLPTDIYVSTITLTCRWDTEINTVNIGKYITLSEGNILAVKYGNEAEQQRTIITRKKRAAKKPKKRQQNFYNQVSIIVQIKKDKRINVKLFKNGSIQLTGCRNISHCAEAINRISTEILKRKFHIKFNDDGPVIESIEFVTHPEAVGVYKIYNMAIRMINSNFRLGFRVNRDKLYELLIEMNITCSYEPVVHACVNVKYSYNETDIISIFVFESGSIIITGAKNKEHIDTAYKFINKLVYNNFYKIVKNDIISVMKRDDTREIFHLAEKFYQSTLNDEGLINYKKIKTTLQEYVVDMV